MTKGEIIEALTKLRWDDEVVVFIRASEILPRKIVGVKVTKQGCGHCGVLEVNKTAKGNNKIYKIEK